MGLEGLATTDLSLVVPTRCNSATIERLVERIHESLSHVSYELIIVDDNSTDGTSELAKELSAQYPLRVIDLGQARGLASAVAAGFEQASGKVLGVIGADLRHPPEMIPALLDAVRDGADVAIASRGVESDGIAVKPIARGTVSTWARALANMLLPSITGVSDPLSEFFLLKREVMSRGALFPTGHRPLLDILVTGRPAKVSEVPCPIEHSRKPDRGLSAGDRLRYLVHFCRLTWAEGGVKRFAKYGAVGLSGTFVDLGLLLLLTEVFGLFYIISAAISYEISILTNYTLNELWTFGDKRSTAEGSILSRGVKFNLVSLVGLVIHMAILGFLTEIVGLFYIVSAIFAIAGAVLWNFTLNVKWTWRTKTQR